MAVVRFWGPGANFLRGMQFCRPDYDVSSCTPFLFIGGQLSREVAGCR